MLMPFYIHSNKKPTLTYVMPTENYLGSFAKGTYKHQALKLQPQRLREYKIRTRGVSGTVSQRGINRKCQLTT